ncbi:recombinase family protein [Qipengyuania sp. YG27]|uniref:Recombinase family protein n=1 Tax=Qipengyuania mesophila TaxID=2867246 RepID=A0ABS7JS29_9SPHN|nr:recombinase family protein [Qipengyuania mesophila]MBX7500441.1 recombinase family protein [Qipengyuania mesophila]
MAERTKPLRCAIYTRKSSEEGLDQDFNSLDAQRAASEAYVLSQTSEGWTLLPKHYDDGGYSGGTMERPGLQALLEDIAAGKIDVVVVYKIDRLTRSLSDFSRIVEIFEKADCSFVSVTQSFNTTNSMGRLMLNVLLSFAQFEREVTGERIRDKIAASKARGMWMGGRPPLGYDLPNDGSRTLRVNDAEAEMVREIFERYLLLGSVHALRRELCDRGMISKVHVTRTGKRLGGLPFSRGALFHLLRNRIYRGEIVHKDQVYQGEHAAIIDLDLFERVQRSLAANARRHRGKSDRRMAKAPLTAKLFDAAGEPMSPTFSQGKSGKAYRYYVSTSLQQGVAASGSDRVRRIPAAAIERLLRLAVERWTDREADTFRTVRETRICDQGLAVRLQEVDPAHIALRLSGDERILNSGKTSCMVLLPVRFPLRGGSRQIQQGKRSCSPDPILIAALRRAHRMIERERGLPALSAAPSSPYDRFILQLALLAPSIQRDILEGRQPVDLSLEKLRRITVPLAWSAQPAALGYPAREDA